MRHLRIGLALALIVAAATVCSVQIHRWHADRQEYFFRLLTAPDKALYFRLRNAELRMAETVHGLAAAEPVRPTHNESAAGRYQVALFPEVALPAGAGAAVPARVTLSLLHVRGGGRRLHRVSGVATVSRTDASVTPNPEWTYAYTFSCEASTTAEEATPVSLALSEKPVLEFKAIPEAEKPGSIGVGARLDHGGMTLQSILRAGAAVAMRVEVLDTDGKVVATRSGGLTDFGFG